MSSFENMVKCYNEMSREERLATVRVTSVSFVKDAMIIGWSGIMGFGEYTVSHVTLATEKKPWGVEEVIEYKLEGDSEHMDSQDSKEFVRHLLAQIADQIQVVS